MMTMDLASVSSIASAIEGKSDDEIVALGQGDDRGIAGILDTLFEGMPTAFKPEAAAGKKAVIQYEITTPDGARAYALKVEDGTCTLIKGAAESPRMTLILSFPDFLRLSVGKLDGMNAFMSGKMKIKGDMMFGQQMANWFETPTA
jgi:putative sterol carrier protein